MPKSLTLSPTLSPFPFASLIAAEYANIPVNFDSDVNIVTLDCDGEQITTEEEIVKVLAKETNLFNDSPKSNAFFSLAQSLPTINAFQDIVAALDSLDDHFALRTYIIGHDLTGADFIIWGALKGSVKITGVFKNNKHVHLLRWFSHIESLSTTQSALASLAEARSNKIRSNKTASSFALGLQGAEDGKVVTRFPPEPSGYLHIGHAKAAVLNQYFANMYHGKLLIRFDDTNPSVEKTEFEDTILEDLRLLNIRGDKVTHTSDYFDQLYDYALQLIKSGKAYADDTEQLQMRAERFDGIASKHRDSSIEDNLKHFNEMKTGSEEGLRWCIRAKISVDDPNKALRDPVIYRCNVLPHHRTGDKWKIYPTYDFACPVVDSLEGVTHALRTNEYRDRNPQYTWMINAIGLRSVNVWDFSRLNFIYTLLSKRKLRWFVEQGLVRGWDDPRFPTVRGIRRRGMTVEAIQQYMLSQGPSQAVVSLEWDSIWAINKKFIDPIAPRFWAITKDKMVPVTLKNGPTQAEIKQLPKHKKNAEVGEKKTVYTSTILVEQTDAISFSDQEEITLMDWGNAFVRSKTVSAGGEVTHIEMELYLEGDFRKTKKKITWLAQPSSQYPLVDITLLDHDYLITKKKLEGDELEKIVTPVTEFREDAWTDANVKDLQKGDIIQFERKGYYIFDCYGDDGKRMEFIHIPDGRAASLASKAEVPNTATSTVEESQNKDEKIILSDGTTGFPIPVTTKMYPVARVYGDDTIDAVADTKMYKVKPVYASS